MNLPEGRPFDHPPEKLTERELKALKLNPMEETWVRSLDEGTRPAGLMWLEWKKSNIKTHDKLSRPYLFMEGYMLGLAFMAHTIDQAKEITTESEA